MISWKTAVNFLWHCCELAFLLLALAFSLGVILHATLWFFTKGWSFVP